MGACIGKRRYASQESQLLDEPYFRLLEALAQGVRGMDPAAFRRAQTLEVRGRRVDFFLERDLHDRAEDRIVLRCDVTHLPASASEPLCRLLLHANNLWSGTRGATLGLRGEEAVMLSVAARVGSLDAARLATAITGLLRQAERWTEEIARSALSAPDAPSHSLHLRA